MAGYIVIRLTPPAAISPATFTNYLTGLTVNVYDISYASASTGGVLLGSAILGNNIVQHQTGTILDSVATAVIAYTPSNEFVAPDLRVEFVRSAQTVSDPNIHYNASFQPGTAPPPPFYQTIPAANVSAYVTVPAPPSSTAAAPLQLSADGSPPSYNDLLTAVTAVLRSDPGPTTLTNAQAAALIAATPLTVDQCRNIASELVYAAQPPLPGLTDSLENMYTDPPNSGAASNPNEQARSAFQGSLTSYYTQNDANAAHLANFVFSLSAAIWCEQQSKAATSAIVDFPVYPNPSTPPINATVSEAEVILTHGSGLGIDIPAEYFYALGAEMPAQMTAAQRFAMATGTDQNQNLAQLTDALNAGWITVPATGMNPAQAVRALGALAVPATSTVTRCDIASIAPIWTDWLAYPTLANWKSYQAGDDLKIFWPGEATAQPAAFLNLVLTVLTQGWVNTVTGNTLASEIKANLVVAATSIHNVGDLAMALPSDWQTFFGPPPPPNTIPGNLPLFTLPGNFAARVAAFIRYFQSLFGVQSVTPTIPAATSAAPPVFSPPASDLIAQTIAAYPGFALGSSLALNTLQAAANTAIAGNPQAQAWAVQAIWTLNQLYILAHGSVPAGLEFSVIEALYARGFTSVEDVLDLPWEDFQQALTGSVAYDFATAIYTHASTLGTPHKCPPTGPEAFTPINPGSLTDCVPPAYLSPLGPTAYLQEMLKVSERSTCDVPFPAAPAGVPGKALATVIAQRRGPIDTTLLATRANLETPLPLIDIVNECLEYAASTTPAGKQGMVYNTAEDLLAGHKLCVEECCNGQEEHQDTGCHYPATLFAALPQYSTPAISTSGASSNAPVEPAVFNILKADFSSCCLPYSQALDVSRTYLEHLRSCRFEVMRTFRKCITEFVLDPEKPPAGFRSYLWRYPVRIDIAIEYLGITPEEYTMVFGGVWPDSCAIDCDVPSPHSKPAALLPRQLYGFAATDERWTATVVELPEFLKRTCLTYCEFIDLWKCGPFKFGNAGDPSGEFPDCEPCCLDKLQLKFPELPGKQISLETSLYLLAVFIRLWHKLKRLCGGGYSFQQLTDICAVLPLFNGVTVNPDFIRQLVAIQMLRDQLCLPLTDECATIAPGAGGADRMFLLSLWAGTGHHWDWALEQFIEGIAHFATCRYGCERRDPEFLKQLAGDLDCLSQLAGFDPAMPDATWHAKPTHTLRFAEILAKIYASHFSIGEILFLFAGNGKLYGEHGYGPAHGEEHEGGYGHAHQDEPERYGHAREDEHERGYGHAREDEHGRGYGHAREDEHERGYGHAHEDEPKRGCGHAREDEHERDYGHAREDDHDRGYDRAHEHEHEHEHGYGREHEHQDHEHHKPRHSPWQLRRKLLEKHVSREATEDWTWSRLESALLHELGLAGEHPSLQRQQTMFECWERIFDYDRVRKESWRRCEHLRFFQDQSFPVYELTTDDLEDERWMVRVAYVERWIASPSRCFAAKDIADARPDLWASDDPAALVAGETETGNANLSRILGNGLIESGAPRRYKDLKQLNDELRESGRCALIAYLCGVNGIVKTPKELSDLLLLDVETGLCEKASRVEEAITAVQTFVQRCRIGLEPGWIVSPGFAHMWDSRFASYHVWQACKRRELYKENWIDWHELDKATKIESFRFMDEELRRVSLTIAAPGGVDYWPEHRPPAPGLCLLQDRDPATMQLLPAARQGLGLLATPERGARPSWITAVPNQKTAASPAPAPTLPPSGCPLPPDLPIWMESAIKLGTRFVRVAAAAYPPASTHFEPWKSSRPAGTTEESCVECCAECGCRHPAHVDEYYFWLVDGRHFDPRSQPVYNNFDRQQNAYYDPAHQESTPWHDPAQLPNLLDWPSKPLVRLAWCRVHNGEFRQPRISDGGIDVSTATLAPDLNFQGRSGDSLFFQVINVAPTPPATPGFRYDLADDLAGAHNHMIFPPPPPALNPPGGLSGYPYFVYFAPGARLFPWSPYSPAIAVANALRAHCRFEAALKWYDRYYDPLVHDNTWTKCVHDDASHPSPQLLPSPQPPSLQPGAAAAVPVAVAPPKVPVEPPIGGGVSHATTTCCDSTDVSCHVARQRSVLLHYVETLVEWGDALMRRDSPEQFQQARVIFDSARRILGRPPHKVLNPAPVNPTAATVGTFVPLFASINPRLMTLYDRVDDRMALIHHCLDARRLRQASERRDAQYWGHDPVRDGWRGDLDHCCEQGDWCHPHSPYRFTFLVQKAKELANQTRELGGALLAAFEKGDAEYLASVRAVHERELLVLGRRVREGEWRDADFQVQALYKTKESDQASRQYYANLIANGLITHENGYVTYTGLALIARVASNAMELIGQLMVTTPDVFSPTSVGVTNQLPVGNKLQGKFTAAARILNVLGDIASTKASLDLTEAGWDRRLQDWVHQVQILDIQIEQVELQILGAERRRHDSLLQLNNQQRQIEQSTEVMNFLRDKFTNHAVYLFLQKNTADLHYRMYELALSAAREAERAFHFERGHDSGKFVSCEGWDNLHEGLLAGERLQLSLARMDKEYCDRNRREYELTKHISLRLQFPMEFLRLKLTGRCEIDLAEWRFDQDYPGQFMRRIKNATITIPGVSGPYNGVHCRLTLLGSSTRVDPLLSLAPAHCCDKCKSGNGYEACPHDPRVVRQYAATEAIATSGGQNDSGLFELNIHDERYLPFEGRGVVSKWRIELPPENNYFDIDTLCDVILHLNYTAREGGERLRHAAREAAEKRLPGEGWCLLDLPHDFPDAWELFRTSHGDQRHGEERHRHRRPRHLDLKFGRDLFPFVPGHRELRIDKMALLFNTRERPDCDCCAGECGCGEDNTRGCWRVGLKGRGECDDASICCTASEDWPDFYHGVVDTRIGLLGRNGDRQEAKLWFPAEVGTISEAFLLCHFEAASPCSDSEDRAVCTKNPGRRDDKARDERVT